MRIDSNTIQVSFESLNYIDFNNKYLVHNNPTKNGIILKDIYSMQSQDLPIGINGITIDNLRQSVSINTSAKLLKENYLEGINKNTFNQFIDSINEMGIIELNPYKVYTDGLFQKIDTTNNVNLTGMYNLDTQWKEVVNCLSIAKMNERFNVEPYSEKGNQGIVYRGNQKEKNRLIMYNKHLDLISNHHTKKHLNTAFMQTIKNPIKFLESTKNVIRVEQNLTSFRAIRERLKIDSNSIQNVLDNGINPNPYMLDKITQPHRENQLLMLFNEYNPDTHKIQDIIELEGMKNIIRKSNYCEKTLKQLIKRYTTDSMFRYYWYGGKQSITPFKPLIQELKYKDENHSPQTNKLIDYIRQSMLNDKVA